MQRQLLPLAAAVLASFAAVVAVSCGGSPATSTPPATATPPPASGDVGRSCKLGPGDAAASCGRQASRLIDFVMAAMEQLISQKPSIFDKNDTDPPGSDNYRVLDKETFLNGMVASLQAASLCAQRDPDDADYEQIQVKNDNSFSETFKVLLGTGHLWHNGACYRMTCLPASFPVQRSADLPPIGGGCGRPYPPPVHHFNVEVHIRYGDNDLLDSTPIVGPDSTFCRAIGYADGRSFCTVRLEGSPERVPCENWRVGIAEDTQRPGPTWRRNGRFCSDATSGCENEPANQYQARAFSNGTYTACAQNGICGSVQVTGR